MQKPEDIKSLQDSRAKIIALNQEAQIAASGELANRRARYQAALKQVTEANAKAHEHNDRINRLIAQGESINVEIVRLSDALLKANESLRAVQEQLKPLEKSALEPLPQPPDTADLETILRMGADTSAVDALLSKAAADEVRFNQYQKNQARQKEREADEALTLSLDATVRELRSKKLAKLKACGSPRASRGWLLTRPATFPSRAAKRACCPPRN